MLDPASHSRSAAPHLADKLVCSIILMTNGDPKNLASTSSAFTQLITGTNQIFITGNTGADSHNISATVVIQ